MSGAARDLSGALKAGMPLWRAMREARFGPAEILAYFDLKSPPVPIEALLARMGVVVHKPAAPGWSGAVHADDARADVWVSADESPGRRNFTLAHELGHLMLHPLGFARRDLTFDGSPEEREANRFASDLLMPPPMLWQYVSPFGADAEKLAARFQVSVPAMNIALGRLARWG